jgi:hypothetical protein
VNPAIDWLEHHPDSPYNLRHTKIISTVHVNDDLKVYVAKPPASYGNVHCRMPMFTIKADLHGHGSWIMRHSRNPDDVWWLEGRNDEDNR